MEPALFGALAAVLGSIVGGSASIATAWITQRTQSRREMLKVEIRKREALYGDFISEASALAVDALDHALDDPRRMMQSYALLNRIRLVSSGPVLDAAEGAIKRIVKQYFSPNLSLEEIRSFAFSSMDDPLREFSTACRKELSDLHRGA
jgi:hypothetical protein